MATHVLRREDRYPVGTSVTARLRSNWLTHELPPTGDPKGSAAATATVQADGSATLTGLADSTDYFAHADISGDDRYVGFRTPVASSAAVSPAGLVLPSDVGLAAWSYDPVAAVSGVAVTAQLQYLARIPVRSELTISTAYCLIGTTGSGGGTMANAFLGVYNSAGVLCGKTADQAANFATVGGRSAALTAEAGQSLTFQAGYIWWSLIIGTLNATPVQVLRSSSSAISFGATGITSPPSRALTKAAVGSALPAGPLDFSTYSNGTGYWGGVS